MTSSQRFNLATKALKDAQKRDRTRWDHLFPIMLNSETLTLHRVVFSRMGHALLSEGLDPANPTNIDMWDQWPHDTSRDKGGWIQNWPETPNRRHNHLKVETRLKHKKGGLYVVKGFGGFDSQNTTHCLYESEDSGILWARRLEEFTPDRFQML